MHRSVSIGVDIGGTKTIAAAVDTDGQVLSHRFVPTPTTSTNDLIEAVAAVVDLVRAATPQASLAPESVVPIGIGVAGLIDGSGGRVLVAPHLPLDGVDLARPLGERLGRVDAVYNDATAAAWAEWKFGAAQGAANAVVLTVGTGLGGGIVMAGQLVAGQRGLAGEFGHRVHVPDGRDCACGSHGCWERYASGTALTLQARDVINQGAPSSLVREFADCPEQLRGEDVTRHAKAGDPLAISLLAAIGEELGRGLRDVIAMLDPAVVVVGGGVSAAGDFVLEPARRAMAAGLIGGPDRVVPPVVVAATGTLAVSIGAADLARDLVVS